MTRSDGPQALTEYERDELDAFELAIAGDAVDPRFVSIERVVVALADDAPRLTPAASELLRRRVEGNVSRRRAARPSLPRLGWISRPAAAALATGLVVLIAAVLVAFDSGTPAPSRHVVHAATDQALAVTSTPQVSTSETTTTPGLTVTSSAQTTTAAEPKQPAAIAGAAGGAVRSGTPPAPAAAPSEAFGPATSSGGAPRQVQHDVDLTLSVPHGGVQAAADGVVALAQRFNGYVASSNVNTGSGVDAQASFTLRLPSSHLRQELGALVALGNVVSLSQNALDITGQVSHAGDSLDQAQAERTSLLRQLAAATTSDQSAAIKAQLRTVDGRIAGDQTALTQLQHRAHYATAYVTIRARPAAVVHHKHHPAAGGWSARKQLKRALNLLERTLTGIVIVLAVVGPILILLGLAWWAASLLRRRRREQALRVA